MAHLAPGEGQVRGGAEAGTAERLAEFILREGSSEGRRLLYLTGDKNRDTLPSMLVAVGAALVTLEVYGTTGSSTFRDDLGAALARAPVGESILRPTRLMSHSFAGRRRRVGLGRVLCTICCCVRRASVARRVPRRCVQRRRDWPNNGVLSAGRADDAGARRRAEADARRALQRGRRV